MQATLSIKVAAFAPCSAINNCIPMPAHKEYTKVLPTLRYLVCYACTQTTKHSFTILRSKYKCI